MVTSCDTNGYANFSFYPRNHSETLLFKISLYEGFRNGLHHGFAKPAKPYVFLLKTITDGSARLHERVRERLLQKGKDEYC